MPPGYTAGQGQAPGKAPATPLLRALLTAAGGKLDPVIRKGVIQISDGSPPEVLERSLRTTKERLQQQSEGAATG